MTGTEITASSIYSKIDQWELQLIVHQAKGPVIK